MKSQSNKTVVPRNPPPNESRTLGLPLSLQGVRKRKKRKTRPVKFSLNAGILKLATFSFCRQVAPLRKNSYRKDRIRLFYGVLTATNFIAKEE